MVSVTKEFEHLKIHLEELRKATNNFGSKIIGAGGFGKVNEGEVSHSKGRSMVAIKRLNRKYGQGDPEFRKEIMMLSRYMHNNLISLLGFCDEDGEKIIVYEHASNGSLDRHLSSTALTWTQRLKICLDVARGLTYLHDHKDTQQRVLHRDIKSANILLDDNWNAKLADMGLSKIGPANQQHTVLFTNVVGTPGYCDPQYMETYALTKESDIYSLGVVLFEVLCGRLCFKYTNGYPLEILVPMWKQSYKHKKLEQVIFKDLTPPMDPTALETFSSIAFQCLHNSREQRPTISLLVKKLAIAPKFQKRHEMKQAKDMGTSRKSSCVDEVGVLFSKGRGLFLNMGKKKRKKAGVRKAGKFLHFDGTTSFTADDLLNASAEVMGESTYGTYYKGTLLNGDHIAVNRLRGYFTKHQSLVEFELYLLGKIRHPNLLAMTAYYLHPDDANFLVYDYTPKGSLAAFLHDPEYKQYVDLSTRMHIVKGVARGLHSLHTCYNIIHGNLTSNNILLDENINPKIYDFGLSQLITASTYSSTISTIGVLGYHAPEVTRLNKPYTKAADVYSLGVIMLEILTGKSPGDVQDLDLPQWVHLMVGTNWTIEVFYHGLQKDAYTVNEGALLNSFKLALDCVSRAPLDRPDIRMILHELEQIRPETATSSRDDGSPGP
ncbi:uncharacterized protein LOC143568521 [Bidens hawaiensis]|uniref:uncharacterized protein LOC143568521 n=1 Tax=Bidens hawaiensis TaxID=980011 RepID=UPI00404A975F